MKDIKNLPIICLLTGWKHLLLQRVKFPTNMVGEMVNMPDGHIYTIFRHMHKANPCNNNSRSIYMVNFKFSKFSDRVNRFLSCIPIPMIAGFPGFCDKVWMRDKSSGYWYGLYEWENINAIEEYKKSFILGLMISRADKKTISMEQISNCTLDDFIITRRNK